jgi:hypothetical protein
MKTRTLLLFALGIILIFALAACGSPAAPTDQAASATTPALDCTKETGTVAADAQALIQEKLQNHHSIDRIYNAQHTRDEWNATLDRMIGYGANISEAEKQTIIDYLMCK